MKLKFAVESNFSDVNYENEQISYFNIEAAENEKLMVIEPKKSTQQLNLKNQLCEVQAIRLTDSVNGVSFAFEPNEKCGYYYSPILFKRPDFSTNKLITSSATFVSTMFWDIDIESGKETEKMINLTITSVKKKQKN